MIVSRRAGAQRRPRDHRLGRRTLRLDVQRPVGLPDRPTRQRPGDRHGQPARRHGGEHRRRLVQHPADPGQHVPHRRQPGLGPHRSPSGNTTFTFSWQTTLTGRCRPVRTFP